MSGFKQDLHYVVRLLMKRPGFAAVIIVSLALGIGANTMIFTLVNGFLLRPLPYPDADRLAIVWFAPPNNPGAQATATRLNCQALRERQTVFEEIGCMQNAAAILGSAGPGAPVPEQVSGQRFTADLPRVIGINPAIGRWFTEEEERDLSRVVLISYDQWQSRFGGSPEVIGQTVQVDSQTATVIGVMPPGFEFLNNQVQYWEPWRDPAYAINSPARILIVIARLKPDGTILQAQAEMDVLAAAIAEEQPLTNTGWTIRVQNMQEALSAGVTAPLMTFQGAVAFVLLIACANVAGLLLAQGVAQHKELALRSALGASRWRIVRQLLTESVLLALAGGVLGLFVGWAGFRAFMVMLPPIGGGIVLQLDGNVLLFTLLLSIAAGIVFGILPALQVSKPDLMDALKENSRSATVTASRQRLRSAFVVVQVSLALVLLISAGLLMRSFLNLNTQETGIDYGDLVTFQIQYPQGGEFIRETGQTTPTGSMEMDFSPRMSIVSEQILERLSTIPGVESATAVGAQAPLSGGARTYAFTIDGQPPVEDPAARPSGQWFPVMSNYFQTLGITVVRGRPIGAQDTGAAAPVAVINETAARQYWPNENPIGQRIRVDFFNDQPREIVGVVGDVRQNLRQEDPTPQVYVPFAQLPAVQEARTGLGLQFVNFVVRSGMGTAAVAPALREAVSQAAPTLALSNMRTIREVVSLQLLDQWIYVTLLGIFGGVAVLLAIVGIYGIMAHSVSQRTGEIGVRIALGANSRQVLGLVLRRGVILIAIGIVIGTVLSLAVTSVIQSVLWGVTSTDPWTFLIALAALALAGLVACYVPARRALKIDPVIALRNE